jgi:uncharacterized damage-inducible protein DinB
MPSPDLTVAELIRWNDSTSSAWFSFIGTQPEILQLSSDIHNSTTVGQVLQHIVAAELRYAERLSELPVSDYSAIPYSTADEIFQVHDRAIALLGSLLSNSSYDWSQEIDFKTLTAGRRRARRSVVLHHALLHSLRHYAQLSTLVRQSGYKPPAGDYLLMASVLL